MRVTRHIIILSILLAVLGSIFLIVAFYTSSQDLKTILINFGTYFISLLVVIFLVNELIARNENQIWAETDEIINNKLQYPTAIFIEQIVVIFGFKVTYDLHKLKTQNHDEILDQGLKILKESVLPEFDSKCANLNDKSVAICEMLQNINVRIDDVFTKFSSRLEPDVFAKLLKIQQLATSIKPILQFYEKSETDKKLELLGMTKDEKICKNLKEIASLILELWGKI